MLKLIAQFLKLMSVFYSPFHLLKPISDNSTFSKILYSFLLFRDLNSSSQCSCLTPTERNYHELTSVGGTAAFIDILAPPYSPEEDQGLVEDQKRDCEFFVEMDQASDEEVSWLRLVKLPQDYYCDSDPYQGPVITEK